MVNSSKKAKMNVQINLLDVKTKQLQVKLRKERN